MHPFLNRKFLVFVVQVLVTTWLDYCSGLGVGLPLKTAQNLQSVQNDLAIGLTGMFYKGWITPVFFHLH